MHLPLFINPQTAAVSIPSGAANQIPHIIDGIVIHVRDIRVYIERHELHDQPHQLQPADLLRDRHRRRRRPHQPADNTPATTNDSFQLANCQNLQFKPKFTVSTSGKTSKADGASLTAKLAYPVAAQGTQANIKEVKVDLPKQLPSRLTTLQKACTAAQFNTNPAGCPAASNIGHAKAITPILPVPWKAPYTSSPTAAKHSPASRSSSKATASQSTSSPQPSSAKPASPRAPSTPSPTSPSRASKSPSPRASTARSTANGNLCSATKIVTVKKKVTVKIHGHRKTITRKVKQIESAPLQMPTEFVAQNGAEIQQDTPVTVTGCPKKAVHAKGAKHTTGGGKKGKR